MFSRLTNNIKNRVLTLRDNTEAYISDKAEKLLAKFLASKLMAKTKKPGVDYIEPPFVYAESFWKDFTGEATTPLSHEFLTRRPTNPDSKTRQQIYLREGDLCKQRHIEINRLIREAEDKSLGMEEEKIVVVELALEVPAVEPALHEKKKIPKEKKEERKETPEERLDRMVKDIAKQHYHIEDKAKITDALKANIIASINKLDRTANFVFNQYYSRERLETYADKESKLRHADDLKKYDYTRDKAREYERINAGIIIELKKQLETQTQIIAETGRKLEESNKLQTQFEVLNKMTAETEDEKKHIEQKLSDCKNEMSHFRKEFIQATQEAAKKKAEQINAEIADLALPPEEKQQQLIKEFKTKFELNLEINKENVSKGIRQYLSELELWRWIDAQLTNANSQLTRLYRIHKNAKG